MISCTLEEGNGTFWSWTPAHYPDGTLETCPFAWIELVDSARVTAFSEDHLIVLMRTSVFIHDLHSNERQIVQINDEDRQTICAMIICAIEPNGETDWVYERFESVLSRLGLIRFIP